MPEEPSLHHVVFAVAPERHAAAAQMFSDLGFVFEPLQLAELGLDIHLDWSRGIELISPIPGSTGEVAVSVTEFLEDRKSTRLNSSHSSISYAVFCLKKKKKTTKIITS